METTAEDRAFSSIDFVGQCLVDEERTRAFQKAIKEKLKKGDVALDLGTGSGIMALSAEKAGAKKVYAVEYDPFVASIAKAIFKENNININKIALLVKDARSLTLSANTKFDVVISEMLTTGMVDEHQVTAITNLHTKGLVKPTTVFIPEKQETYVALGYANHRWLGLATPMILHLWRWHN